MPIFISHDDSFDEVQKKLENVLSYIEIEFDEDQLVYLAEFVLRSMLEEEEEDFDL